MSDWQVIMPRRKVPLSALVCVRNEKFFITKRERINNVVVRIVSFFLRSIGTVVLPHMRKSKSPVAEWVVLFLLET